MKYNLIEPIITSLFLFENHAYVTNGCGCCCAAVFNYVPGLHNTYEVNEDTYRSCNTSQGVIATYYSGHDQVTLNETGDHWFLCNIQDHCKGGMKFGVKVEAIMNTSQMTSGSMGFTTTSIGGWRWLWTFDLVPLVGLFMLNY